MKRKILLPFLWIMIFCSLSCPAQAKHTPAGPEQDRAKETLVLVPAEEMRLILGIEKEGIFVPYGEYRRLYERAKKAYREGHAPEGVPPGVEGPVVVAANYSGSVIGEVLQFEATFEIVQNADGPSILPFPLEAIGYQKATLDGVDVQIYARDGEPRIIIPGKGNHHLSVTFLVPIRFAENKGIVSFRIPPAILGEIRIASDLFYEVKLKDSLFTSRRQFKDTVEISGFIGARDTVSLEIINRRSFVGERGVKISSEEKHRVLVDRDIIHHKGEFTLTVQDGVATGVDIEIGQDDHVYSLSGSGIAGWSREARQNKDILHVRFHVPITDQTRFCLKTYAYIDPHDRSFRLTDTLIKDLFERAGSLSVFYASGTRITEEDGQFLKPLEHPLTRQEPSGQYTLHGGYSLFNLPFRLAFSFQDVPPRTTCYQQTQVYLGRSRIRCHGENRLQGLAPGTTHFTFSFPAEYRVKDVTASVNGQTVRTFHHHEAGKDQLSIDIMHPVGPDDQVSFVIESEKLLDEDRLEKGSFTVTIPVVSYTDTQHMEGILRLSIDEIFFLEDMTMRGYISSEGMVDDRPDGSPMGKTLVYDVRSLSPEGTLTLSYRRSKQRSQTVSYVAVDQDILNATTYVRYEVSPGSQDSFYFAVPRWDDSKINIVGPHIKEKKTISIDRLMEVMEGSSLPDLKNHDIWNVVLEKEVRGTYVLSIDYQKKIRQDGSLLDVPLVVPVGVENDTGHIVLEASRDTEIRTQKIGLNEVETYELPEWPSYKASNRIIESLRYFARPFDFRIAVFKRDELPVLGAIAQKEDIQYSFGKDSDLFFEFNYTIRNTNLQFLEIGLPEHHILWGGTLQEKGIKPRKGEDNVHLLQLPPGDDPIHLRLVGHVPAAGWKVWKSFDFQSPGLTIPCMESQIRIFFPKDYVILGAKGNFETLPELSDERPLVLSFLDRVFSGFFKRMQRFSLIGPLGRGKGTGVTGKPAPKMDAPLESREEGTAAGTPTYAKKKGILSMHIRIPKEGNLLPATKLCGKSMLRVTFLFPAWKKGLAMFATLLSITLGLFLTRRGIMSPVGFLITALVFFTLLPFVFLKSLTFVFNGAVFGAVLFMVMGCVPAVWKKSGSKTRLGLVFLCVLLPLLLFPIKSTRAESRETFPDVEIYVPYGEKIPFELEDSQEVFIPTEDYFRLRFLADPPYRPDKPFPYEREYTITGFAADGTIEEDTVRFTASFDVFINHEKWALIELPFSGVFVEALKLDAKEIPVRIKGPTSLEQQPSKPQEAIYEIPILGAGHHTIDLTFCVEAEATHGKKTMAFGFPESLCTDFSLAIDEKEVLLEFEEPETGYYLEDTPEGLVARASLSQKSSVRVSWFPKRFVKRTEKPLVYADCYVSVLMDHDKVLLSQRTEIQVEKSSLASMAFQIPSGLSITDVFSAEVRSWRVKEENGQSMLEVVFKKEISETADLLIKARKKTMPGQPVPAIFIQPLDSERVRGDLNLYGVDDTKILVENIRGLRIADLAGADHGKFPGFELQKRYVFSGPVFEADIRSLPRDVRIHADVQGRYLFSEHLLTVQSDFLIEVKEGFLTSVRLRMPKGFRVRTVHAGGISDYHLQDGRILVLPFQYALKGKYRFNVILEKDLSAFDAAAIEGLELLDTERINGQCVVLFPKGFDIRQAKTSELRPINVRALSTQLTEAEQARFGATYAYRFREKSFKATYDVSRKQPSIDVVKVYHARVEDNLVNLKVLSLLSIRNAPVYQFEILVPVRFKDSIEIEGEGIRTILKKVDAGGDRVRLTVHTLSGIEDSYLMALSLNVYLGKDRVFEMPQIVFPQAASRTEFVSVERATVYQVETKPPPSFHEVAREMVPAFPAGINLSRVLWAYRISGSRDWNYRLELKRLEREDLVTATVSRQDIRTVFIPQGYAINEVNLRVNNRVLQFLPLNFPSDAELWTLKVANEPIRASIAEAPEEKDKRRLLVPLIKSGTGDRSFDVRLIYVTPAPELGLWGKTNLTMVETGDIPVEKTTWTLFLPKTFAYPRFKGNMEEIDISVIEADKTLDLANEYEYWTNLAKTVTGGLRQRAMSNREQVMTDYLRQQALVEQMQSDLEERIEQEKQTGRQARLQSAQSQNIAVLDEARKMIESSEPVPSTTEISEEPAERQVISKRKDIQGWQFKTRDFAGEDKVERSIRNLIRSEDTRREFREKQEMRKKGIPLKASLDIAKEEEVLAQAPPRSTPEKPAVEHQAAQVRRSTLLKGLRSVDIELPEQGTRHCFKKLGGNPTITLTYRKKGIFSKLFSLAVLLAAKAGTLRVRRWHPPVERMAGFLKDKSLSDCYGPLMRSRVVKIIPTVIMVAGVFLGLPWFIMGVGLNTVLLVRYLSRKRYEKKGYEPPYNYVVFFKYLLSYMILAFSFLLIVTAFHPFFLMLLTVSTILNCLYVAVYAMVYLFTRRSVIDLDDLD